jgi:hypothetical protein
VAEKGVLWFSLKVLFLRPQEYSLKTKKKPKIAPKPGVVVQTCNPSTQEAEAGGS